MRDKISLFGLRGATLAAAPLIFAALGGCGSKSDSSSSAEAFELRFAPVVDGKVVGCNDELSGFGASASDTIGINDLRFYVSNIRFLDKDGKEVVTTLDQNEFQYASPEGGVSLVDLTGNTEGTCSAAAFASSEGTARTHTAVTGTTFPRIVASVAFDVGVPQAVMKKNIATNTAEGSPSPLNEMYWNWNSGYRHFVFNFTVKDTKDAKGSGFVHIGSRDCAPGGEASKALEDRDSCTYVNTPAVTMAAFDLATNSIGLDLRKLAAGLDFVSPVYDPKTYEVIGEGPGVECHSSPSQPDCSVIFGSFGLDMTTGKADAGADLVFLKI